MNHKRKFYTRWDKFLSFLAHVKKSCKETQFFLENSVSLCALHLLFSTTRKSTLLASLLIASPLGKSLPMKSFLETIKVHRAATRVNEYGGKVGVTDKQNYLSMSIDEDGNSAVFTWDKNGIETDIASRGDR